MNMPYMESGLTRERYIMGQAAWPARRFAFAPSLCQQRQHLDPWKECNKAINDAILPARITNKNTEALKQAKGHVEVVVRQERKF